MVTVAEEDETPLEVPEGLTIPEGARKFREGDILNGKPMGPKLARQMRELRRIEDKILIDSWKTIQGGLAGADVDDGQETVPSAWVKKYGRAEAEKRLRMATDIRKPTSERPGYFDLALRAAKAISVARATEKAESAPQPLNVAVVYVQPAAKQYKVIDVEPEEIFK